MKNICCVPFCKSNRKNVKMHCFPKTEIALQKWVNSINCEDISKLTFKELRTMFVCHKHFEKRFVKSSSRLTQSAYPTLLSNEEISTGIPYFSDANDENPCKEHDYIETRKRKQNDHSYCKPLHEIQMLENEDAEAAEPTQVMDQKSHKIPRLSRLFGRSRCEPKVDLTSMGTNTYPSETTVAYTSMEDTTEPQHMADAALDSMSEDLDSPAIDATTSAFEQDGTSNFDLRAYTSMEDTAEPQHMADAALDSMSEDLDSPAIDATTSAFEQDGTSNFDLRYSGQYFTPEQLPVFCDQLHNLVEVIRNIQSYATLTGEYPSELERRLQHEAREVFALAAEARNARESIARTRSQRRAVRATRRQLVAQLSELKETEMKELESTVRMSDRRLFKNWEALKDSTDPTSFDSLLEEVRNKQTALDCLVRLIESRQATLTRGSVSPSPQPLPPPQSPPTEDLRDTASSPESASRAVRRRRERAAAAERARRGHTIGQQCMSRL